MISPELRRRLIVSFALVLAFCAVSYLWIDRPVAEWFKANLTGQWSVAFHKLTNLGRSEFWLVPAAAVAILGRWGQIRAKTRDGAETWRIAANAGLFLFLSVAASGIAVDIVKALVGRLRPNEWFVHGAYGFQPFSIQWSLNSFPSGHGQTAIAAATALIAIAPRGKWLWLAIGASIAASRAIVSVHYVSDVAMGAWFGWAGTVLLAPLFARNGWRVRLTD